jgi:DNA-directed RNA polymerase subunit D
MKVKMLNISDDTVRFIVEDADVAFANALRRTMIKEVPCMTIDDLFIFDNSSVIPDEVLAQRIGLIPIITDLDNYILPEECECGSDLGCSKCRTVLTLDVEVEEGTRTVTSGDFVSEDPRVVPISPNIPLTKLAPKQVVRLEAYAKLGKGKVHAKWQPVSMAVYQNIAEIKIDEKNCSACAECIKACPSKVFEIQDLKVKLSEVRPMRRLLTLRLKRRWDVDSTA